MAETFRSLRVQLGINLKAFATGLTKAGSLAATAGVKIRRVLAFNIGGAVKRLAGSILNLRNAFIALAAGAAIRSFVKAAQVQEDAVNSLNSALRATGQFSEENSLKIQKFASALQEVTRFGDEATLSAQALLITLGVTTDQLGDATKATLNLAAAQGLDLKVAALQVGKAAAGFTASLGRYGIRLDETIPETEKFNEVLRQLNDPQGGFGGRAQADVKTFSGRLQQMKNAFGDLQEVVGFSIIRSGTLIDKISDMKTGFIAVQKAVEALTGTGFGDFLSNLIPSASTIVSVFFGIARAANAIQQGLSVLKIGFLAIGQGMTEIAIVGVKAFTEIVNVVSTAFARIRLVVTEVIAVLLQTLSKMLDSVRKTAEGFSGVSDTAKSMANSIGEAQVKLALTSRDMFVAAENALKFARANRGASADVTELEKRVDLLRNALEAEKAALVDNVAAAAQLKKVQEELEAQILSGALTQELANIQLELAKQKIMEQAQAAADAKTPMQEWAEANIDRAKAMQQAWTQFADSFASGIGAAFADVIVMGESFSQSFSQLFKQLARDIVRELIRITIAALIAQAATSFVTGAPVTDVSAVATAGGAQIAKALGKPTFLAHGGIVTAPTLAMIGESGPEAVIPLDRGGMGAQTIIIELDGRNIAKATVPHMPGVLRIETGIGL